jgi:hypothetical protein
MEQLLVHVFADYLVQSDHMALNKSKRTFPCLVHVVIYTACFLILTTSWKALLVIGGTHFILDRFPVILRRLIWWKNHLSPHLTYAPYEKCQATGYYDNLINEVTGKPSEKFHEQNIFNEFGCWKANVRFEPRLNYISIWLYIITDNFFHLTINYFALKYLP